MSGGDAGREPAGSSEKLTKRLSLAQAAGEERLGTLREDRDRWQRLAMIMCLVAASTTGFGIWAAVSTEYVPYIVAVDDLGQTRIVQSPKVIENWPDAAVRRELGDFVGDWRSITSDEVVLRKRYQRLQYFLEENSVADRKVREWAIRTEPLKLATKMTVDVNITSVNYVGGRTWLVEWVETQRMRGTGKIEGRSKWRGSFVLRQRRITNQAWLNQNPFGMIIEDTDVRRLDG